MTDIIGAPRAPRAPRAALPATRAVLERGVELGWHGAAEAVAATTDGRWFHITVGQPAVGPTDASAPPLWPWLCAAKPLLAVAVARAVESGQIRFEDPVAGVIPEFAANGKANVTIRDVLLHMSGFKEDPVSAATGIAWEDAIAELCASPLEPGWAPGVDASYLMYAYWYLLGEILERLTGRDLAVVLRESVLDPLGMHDTWVGASAEDFRDRAEARIVPLVFHRPEAGVVGSVNLGAQSTGHSIFALHGSLADLVTFYLAMLDPATDRPAIGPAMLAEIIEPRRVGVYDHVIGGVLDYSLAFQLESRRHGGTADRFGKHATPNAFGHLGGRHMGGLADPGKGIAVAFATDQDAEALLAQTMRCRRVFSALYQDLGAT